MAPVLLTLILGLAIAIERVLYLAMSNNNNEKLLKDVEDALKAAASLQLLKYAATPVVL
jgi:biopolymer transport protein ExbB